MHIKGFDPFEFSKKEVEGVTVYMKHLPWAPCVHINWIFSTGAFADPLGKEGVAHFLEHLIGNGSPMLPDKKTVKEFSRAYMLNSRNAFTSHYATRYVGKCLPEHFPKVFEVSKDYVFNPFLRPEDIEHERKVITQEAWGRYKNEKFLSYVKEVAKNVFGGHERERIASPLGWPETVANMTRNDIESFHKRNYTKGNLTLLLVGAVEGIDASQLKEILGNIPEGVKFESPEGKIGKPLTGTFERTGEEIGQPSEQLSFSIFRAKSAPASERLREVSNHAKVLLYDILFERLRLEHSLCYGVKLRWGIYEDYLEAGISVDTSEDNLEVVKREVENVISEIVDGKWKTRFETMHKLAIDQIKSTEWTSEAIASKVHGDIQTLGRIIPLSEFVSEAEKVTYEDVRDFIKEIFDPEYVFTEIILPSRK